MDKEKSVLNYKDTDDFFRELYEDGKKLNIYTIEYERISNDEESEFDPKATVYAKSLDDAIDVIQGFEGLINCTSVYVVENDFPEE